MIFAVRNVEKRGTMYIEADSALEAAMEARKIIVGQNEKVGKIKEGHGFFYFESNGSLICLGKEGVKL